VLGGVCGGLGHYLGIDPVLVRIAALVLVFAGGAGILLYLIGWIAIPEESDAEAAARPQAVRHGSGAVAGILFVAVGGVLLLDQLLPDVFDWRFVGPLVLIGIGVALLAGRRR